MLVTASSVSLIFPRSVVRRCFRSRPCKSTYRPHSRIPKPYSAHSPPAARDISRSMAQMQEGGAAPLPTAANRTVAQAPEPHPSDMLFAAAMPKQEIGALQFLKVSGAHLRHIVTRTIRNGPAYMQDHSDSDGRGVIVAIFDTGVDPGLLLCVHQAVSCATSLRLMMLGL